MAPPGLLYALSSAKRQRRRLASTATMCRCSTLAGGLMGVCRDVLDEDLDQRLGVPAEHRRAALYYSWRAFVVRAYEWTILWAALTAAFGMLAMCGLPAPYHPLFNAPNFRTSASSDKFFLCLEAARPPSSPLQSRGRISRRCIRYRSCRWSIKPQEPSFAGPDGLRDARASRAEGIGRATAAIVLIAGCRQDMHNQPKFVPQRGTDFFPGWPFGARSGDPIPSRADRLIYQTFFSYRPPGRKEVGRATLPSHHGPCWSGARSNSTPTARPATLAWATAPA